MSTASPTVTAVVPNYNYEASLELCLRALLAQTYPNLSVLVVDDCSTDRSVEVARSLGVEVVSTPTNSGVAAARNLGAERADGEIIFFCDSDVALAPDAVANAVEVFRVNPDAAAVCGIYEPEPLTPGPLVKDYRSLQINYWMSGSEGRLDSLHTAICAIRADVFAKVGTFNPRLRHTEDGDYGTRLVREHLVLSTTSVHGRHDHDDTLRMIVRKVYHRTRNHIPLYARQRAVAGEYSTVSRGTGTLAALLAVATTPAPVLLGPAWAVLPAGLLAASLWPDRSMYRYVVDRRGPAFGVYFAGVNVVVSCSIAAGIVSGAGQWLVSRRFRRMYDGELESVAGPPVRAVA